MGNSQHSMIQYGGAEENRNVWQMVFAWHGCAFQSCYMEIIVAGLLGVLAQCMRDPDIMDLEYKIEMQGHYMCLFPVAYLLVFRNGQSYIRFWEGRGHCGKFVLSARSLCRRAATHVVAPAGCSEEVSVQIRNFRFNVGRLIRIHAICQRNHMRHVEDQSLEDVGRLLSDEEKAEFKRVGKNFCQLPMRWMAEQWMSMKPYIVHEKMLDATEKNIQDMTEAWMGMHKLATTPMPFPIIQSLLTLMYLWIYTFPFAFATDYGWASPPTTFILAASLFGLNSIGAELEDPMGDETNDLPYEVFMGAANQASKVNKLGWPPSKDQLELLNIPADAV